MNLAPRSVPLAPGIPGLHGVSSWNWLPILTNQILLHNSDSWLLLKTCSPQCETPLLGGNRVGILMFAKGKTEAQGWQPLVGPFWGTRGTGGAPWSLR